MERFAKELKIPARDLINQAQAWKIDNLSNGVIRTLNATDYLDTNYPTRY